MKWPGKVLRATTSGGPGVADGEERDEGAVPLDGREGRPGGRWRRSGSWRAGRARRARWAGRPATAGRPSRRATAAWQAIRARAPPPMGLDSRMQAAARFERQQQVARAVGVGMAEDRDLRPVGARAEAAVMDTHGGAQAKAGWRRRPGPWPARAAPRRPRPSSATRPARARLPSSRCRPSPASSRQPTAAGRRGRRSRSTWAPGPRRIASSRSAP